MGWHILSKINGRSYNLCGWVNITLIRQSTIKLGIRDSNNYWKIWGLWRGSVSVVLSKIREQSNKVQCIQTDSELWLVEFEGVEFRYEYDY